MAFMGRKPKERREPYGAWLQHLRKEKGLSQQDLARIAGVAQSTLVYWERSGKLTGREIIIKMAKALGVSMQTLMRVGKQKPGT